MSVQIIEKDNEPEYAVLPYAEYLKLVEMAEDAADIAAFDAALRDEAEAVPDTVVQRLVGGENPVRVWREHRGLTQGELAGKAGIAPPYLSQIEAGSRKGSAEVLKKLKGIQKDFNKAQSGNKRVSLADVIVLGGAAAIEKAAKSLFTISESLLNIFPGSNFIFQLPVPNQDDEI